ncbi:MAG: hypothetical protein BWY95_00417 [Bacteroidetes bacterium ADurb.BinA104]|nr:MAG: hypothetical protein BWY95_00417 [Bacteroidetes bacterium ADurb.BinA104]
MGVYNAFSRIPLLVVIGIIDHPNYVRIVSVRQSQILGINRSYVIHHHVDAVQNRLSDMVGTALVNLGMIAGQTGVITVREFFTGYVVQGSYVAHSVSYFP